MSRPIVTLALSDDGNSVFVYSGGYDPASDNTPNAYDEDTRSLEAVIGIQREDFREQLRDWAESLVVRAVQ